MVGTKKMNLYFFISRHTIIQYIAYCIIDAIHDFSVWLRTGFNPADNRFRSHTGKELSIHLFSMADGVPFSLNLNI